MFAHPCSDTGRLQSQVRDLERKMSQCAQAHEVYQTSRDVGNLEHTVRELSAVVDELRYRVEIAEEDLRIFKEGSIK